MLGLARLSALSRFARLGWLGQAGCVTAGGRGAIPNHSVILHPAVSSTLTLHPAAFPPAVAHTVRRHHASRLHDSAKVRHPTGRELHQLRSHHCRKGKPSLVAHSCAASADMSARSSGTTTGTQSKPSTGTFQPASLRLPIAPTSLCQLGHRGSERLAVPTEKKKTA